MSYSYIVDMCDGKSVFLKLEMYEEIFIYPMYSNGLFVVEVRDCTKPFKSCTHSFTKVEKFTMVSDE